MVVIHPIVGWPGNSNYPTSMVSYPVSLEGESEVIHDDQAWVRPDSLLELVNEYVFAKLELERLSQGLHDRPYHLLGRLFQGPEYTLNVLLDRGREAFPPGLQDVADMPGCRGLA